MQNFFFLPPHSFSSSSFQSEPTRTAETRPVEMGAVAVVIGVVIADG